MKREDRDRMRKEREDFKRGNNLNNRVSNNRDNNQARTIENLKRTINKLTASNLLRKKIISHSHFFHSTFSY